MIWGSAFNYYSNGGPSLLLTVAMSNLYVFTLVYLYTPTGKGNEDIAKLTRRHDINQDLENEYSRLPMPKEQELIDMQEERLEQQPRTRLRGVDDKPLGYQAPDEDENENTFEDYEAENKRATGTSLGSRPTLSPQRPLADTRADDKKDDPFTL